MIGKGEIGTVIEGSEEMIEMEDEIETGWYPHDPPVRLKLKAV
jgi:hypothetical protein